MALWKPFRGNRTALDAVEMHDGYVYFCTDDGSLFFDYVDADGSLQRKQINAKDAETLTGMTLDEIKEYVAVQSDWNQNDSTAVDYIKNRTHYEEGIIVVDNLTSEDYSVGNNVPPCNFTVGKVYNVVWNGVLYENLLCWNNGEFNVLGTSDGLPFYIDDDGGDSLFVESFAQDEDGNALPFTVSIIELIIHKLDKKYLPNDTINVQSDWNQNDNSQLDYIKNRTHYEVDEEIIVAPSTEVKNRYTISLEDASVFEVGKQCVVTIDGTRYETTVRSDVNFTIDSGVNTYSIGIGSWMATNTMNSRVSVVELVDNCPFMLGLNGDALIFVYEAANANNDVHTVEVSLKNYELHQLDEKYIPNTIVRVSDIPDQAQSNWNTYDTVSASYIQNRPMYFDVEPIAENLTASGKTSERTVITPEFVPVDGTFYYVKGVYTNDKAVTTVFDGVYECKDGTIDILPWDGSGCPILNITSEGISVGVSNSYRVASVVIDVIGTATYHTLDEKYIPDTIARVEDILAQAQSDWNQVDNTASDYIKNRPFYSEVVNNTYDLTIDEQSSDGGTSTDATFAKLLYENYTNCVYEVFNGNAWHVGNIDSVETTDAYLVIEISCPLESGNTLGHTVKIAHDYSSINWVRATELSGSKIRFTVTSSDEVIHQIEQKYIPNTFATKDYVQSFLPKSTTVTLLAANWTGDANPWSQVVTINGATENSKLDLLPSSLQIVSLQSEEISLMLQNDAGTVTAWAIGNKPTEDYTMQVLITEVVML